MKKFTFRRRVTDFLMPFLYTQSIVTLVSLPILVAWGIPVSVMSPVGNLVFVPFLSATLFLCSCLFAAFLGGFEPSILTFAIKKMVTAWLWCLGLGSPSWMIGFSFPGIIGLSCLSLFSWWVIRSYVIRRYLRREILAPLVLVGYSLLLFTFTLFTKRDLPALLTIPETDNKLVLITDLKGTTTLTDNGFFETIRDPQKFIAYTLRPYLIKKYGITSIHQGKITNVSKKTLAGLTSMTTFYAPDQVDIPWFKHLEKKEWHAFFTMKRTAQNYQTTFNRYSLEREGEKRLHGRTRKKNITNTSTQRQRKMRKASIS